MGTEFIKFLKNVNILEGIAIVNFGKIEGFEELKKLIIQEPEDYLHEMEQFIEKRSDSKEEVRIRLENLPKNLELKIKHLRSINLNEIVIINGIIKQASDVRPQVVNAKFKCSSCRAIIPILQIEKKFKEPSKCYCGKEKEFELISKEMVDTQRLVIEELPEVLKEGEEPRTISVFIKEELVDPKMEEITIPGTRVKVIGVLKEVSVPLEIEGISTRFELAIEGNNLFLDKGNENK